MTNIASLFLNDSPAGVSARCCLSLTITCSPTSA